MKFRTWLIITSLVICNFVIQNSNATKDNSKDNFMCQGGCTGTGGSGPASIFFMYGEAWIQAIKKSKYDETKDKIFEDNGNLIKKLPLLQNAIDSIQVISTTNPVYDDNQKPVTIRFDIETIKDKNGNDLKVPYLQINYDRFKEEMFNDTFQFTALHELSRAAGFKENQYELVRDTFRHQIEIKKPIIHARTSEVQDKAVDRLKTIIAAFEKGQMYITKLHGFLKEDADVIKETQPIVSAYYQDQVELGERTVEAMADIVGSSSLVPFGNQVGERLILSTTGLVSVGLESRAKLKEAEYSLMRFETAMVSSKKLMADINEIKSTLGDIAVDDMKNIRSSLRNLE